MSRIYSDTMNKMGIDPSRIKPNNSTFERVIPGVEASCSGTVTLEVVFGSPNNFRSKDLIVDIVPFRSGYHALLGHTTFACFNVVLHYAYLKIKIPEPRGVITVNGNIECSLGTKEHTMPFVVECQYKNEHEATSSPLRDDRRESVPELNQIPWRQIRLLENRGTVPTTWPGHA